MRQTNYRIPQGGVIYRLQAELWDLRQLIIGMMPADIQEILTSGYKYTSHNDRARWEGDVIAVLISISQPIDGISTNRARCPLCGCGTSAHCQQGFSLPEGLHRHLTGCGTTHQCKIMKVAVDMTHAYSEMYDDNNGPEASKVA